MPNTMQAELQRLSGTSLDAQGAANAWAGTVGLALLRALNVKAGTTGLDLQQVCNVLGGTSGLAETAALRARVAP